MHQSRNAWIGNVFNTNNRLVVRSWYWVGPVGFRVLGSRRFIEDPTDVVATLYVSDIFCPPFNILHSWEAVQRLCNIGRDREKHLTLDYRGGENCLSRLPRFAKVVTGRKVLKQEAKTVSLLQ